MTVTANSLNATHRELLEPLDYSSVDDIVTITFNRPKSLNAVTHEMIDELCNLLRRARREGAAVLILTGAGRAFCAGHDRKQTPEELATIPDQYRIQRIQDVTREIAAAPFPVIAAVHGYAVGAGAEWALGCDFVVAAEDAKFRFPEVSIGFGVGGGISSILPWTAGPVIAKEIILLGRDLLAAEAREYRLVNRVVPVGQHLAEAQRLAEQLRANPRQPAAVAKSLLNRGVQSSLEVSIDAEVAGMVSLHLDPSVEHVAL